MKYLIAIAIGPVQDFIASARRSRDLWFGSWLLSELSKAAANRLADGNEKRLIFPAVSDLADLKPAAKAHEPPDGYFSVVNKITAVVETENVRKLSEDVLNAMRNRLSDLRSAAFRGIETSQYFDGSRAKTQIDDLIEYYWAAVQLLDEKHYKAVRAKAEALLIARKNTRDFKSAEKWAKEGLPKSSLDGLRESVIKKEAYDLPDEERRRKFETRPGERLCGVGLLKRLGNGEDEEGFFSTSHLAAFPLLSNLRQADSDTVAQYFDKLKEIDKSAWSSVSGNGSSEHHLRIACIFQRNNKPCDGRLLFEDRLAEYFDKRDTLRQSKINAAKAALRKFLKDALGDRKPSPYYALLLADGDGMGKAIEQLERQDKHQAMSFKLSDFAKGVRTIVETTHHGSLIYAGGDDVLAFVPMHKIMQCAKALAKAFRTAMRSGLEGAPTLSVGVAICHHLDPLSDALTLAREAEKEAKRLPGKNALCVKLDKRGGETTTVVDHWDKLDERLEFFTLLFVSDKLPDGVAYEFRKLADQLHDAPAAVLGEVRRILKRKHAGDGEELDKQVIDMLAHALRDLDKVKPNHGSLGHLAEELIVARTLAAAREQSHQSREAAKEAAQIELAELLKTKQG